MKCRVIWAKCDNARNAPYGSITVLGLPVREMGIIHFCKNSWTDPLGSATSRLAPRQTETKLTWAVSPLLDDRIEGHKELLKLDGRNVLLPREKKFHPAEASLTWRWERLLR